MTATVVSPEDAMVVPERVVVVDTRTNQKRRNKQRRKQKSLAKRLGKRLKKLARKWAILSKKARRKAWEKIRALRSKMVFWARRSGQAVSSAAKATGSAAERGVAWTIGAGAQLGRAVVRGAGYVGYGLSVGYGWLAQSIQGAFFLTALGIIGALAIAVKLTDFWVEAYEYDAKFWRWVSMGRKKRNKIRQHRIKVPYFWRRGVKHSVGENETRRERFVNRVASVLMGQKVEITEVYDIAKDEAIGPDDVIIEGPVREPGAGTTSPWTSATDPRLDDYEGMNLGDVLERHKKRLDYATDHDGLDQVSYWSGRIFFLEAYLADEENLSRLDALYNSWRDQQPKKRGAGPGGLARGKFRDGMIDERRILREEWALHNPAPANAGSE
jgi:hypothetical protein